MNLEPDDFSRFDPAQLERLVDGEATLEELREIVEACEQDEAGWRECALAFLENQAWEQELQGMVGADLGVDLSADLGADRAGAWPPSVGEELADQALGGGRSSTQPDDPRVEPATRNPVTHRPTPPEMTNPPRSAWRWNWLRGRPSPAILTASLLVAFACGLIGRTWWFAARDPATAERSDLGIAGDGEHRPSGSPDATLVKQPAPAGQVQLDFPTEEDGEWEVRSDAPLEVPLYAGDRLPPPTSIDLPLELRRRMAEQNVQVRSKRQLVELKTQDGKTVFVPLETIDFVPLTSTRYQ